MIIKLPDASFALRPHRDSAAILDVTSVDGDIYRLYIHADTADELGRELLAIALSLNESLK